MPVDYLPILILVVLSTAFAAIALIVPALLGPKRAERINLSTYECGKIPFAGPWEKRISIKYYVFAVLFLLFDVEVIFLYPWAVLLRALKWFGLIEMAIFVGILLAGYIYVWRKGAFEWD